MVFIAVNHKVFSVTGMVLQNDEFDEGVVDDESLSGSWSSSMMSSAYRKFQSLNQVVRFCETRLLRRHIDGNKRHYYSVCKALYIEVSELKAFLSHVLYGFEERQEVSLDQVDGPDLAKKYVKDWARLWIVVMDELRQKTKERRTQILPQDYQHTPFYGVYNEELRETIKSTRKSKSDRFDKLPENAEDRIFEFIRSRVSSFDENEQDDELKNEVNRKYLLSETSNDDRTDMRNEVFIYSDDNGNDEEIYKFSNEKRIVPVNDKLVQRITDWDGNSDEGRLEDEFLEGGYETEDESDETKIESQNIKRSDSLGKKRLPLSMQIVDGIPEQTIQSQKENELKTDDGLPDFLDISSYTTHRQSYNQNNQRWRSTSKIHELSDNEADLPKIGNSLTEVFKIRQEITRSELEFSKDSDLRDSKKCFSCRKNKFTLFQRACLCSVCNKKHCIKCIRVKVNIPHSLLNAVPPNIDISYDGTNDLSYQKSSKSLTDLMNMTSQLTNGLPWMKNRHAEGLQLNMCKECENFLNSIETENKTSKWEVRLELDL